MDAGIGTTEGAAQAGVPRKAGCRRRPSMRTDAGGLLGMLTAASTLAAAESVRPRAARRCGPLRHTESRGSFMHSGSIRRDPPGLRQGVFHIAFHATGLRAAITSTARPRRRGQR